MQTTNLASLNTQRAKRREREKLSVVDGFHRRAAPDTLSMDAVQDVGVARWDEMTSKAGDY